MELLLLLPILWSIRNLLNNCRNVFKSLWVQPKIFEIGVSWVFIIAIHIQLFFSLFLKIYDGLGFLRRKIRCMSLSLAIVICWVWQFWHPFEIVEKLPLWQSDICEMEPSLYPAGGRTANQGRSLLEKWSWFIVKVVERNSSACSPCYQLSITLWPWRWLWRWGWCTRWVWPSCYLLSIIPLTSCMAPIVAHGKGETLDTCIISGNGRKWMFDISSFAVPRVYGTNVALECRDEIFFPKRYVWKRSLLTRNIFTN